MSSEERPVRDGQNRLRLMGGVLELLLVGCRRLSEWTTFLSAQQDGSWR